MASREASKFPSVSLGRVSGSQLKRESGSQESLTAHPLLSPPPTVSTSAGTPQAPERTGSPTPKYVPYTPRQRVAPTTGTSTANSVGVGSTRGGDTSQLYLQNLKAAAQAVHLPLGSVGWAFCEKICSEGDKPEWEEIWSAVINNAATLLLPADQLGNHEVITPELVRDHVVFCTAPSNSVIPIVTLSGLRGTLVDQTLTFRSTIATTSNQFQTLLVPATRFSTLATLPPLPSTMVAPLKPEYPHIDLLTSPTTLPFPSQPLHRPTARAAISSVPRISAFVSLFGARSSPATISAPLPTATNEELENITTIDVSVYPIQGRIVRRDILKDISNSLQAEIKESLTGIPSWVTDRTLAFVSPLHPGVKTIKRPPPLQKSPVTAATQLVPDMSNPTATAESFQLFYASIEDELHAKKQTDEKQPVDLALEDEKIKQQVERVERTVCALFYDQIFRPTTSDDASHDEALASRIAALNMLDLGLEHLGIDAGKAGSAVQAVVTTVGQTLQRLQDSAYRGPADKAAVLVAAHNVAVEGLSKLPPIRLKPDEEVDHDQTPMASTFKHGGTSPVHDPKSSGRISEAQLPPLPEDATLEIPAYSVTYDSPAQLSTDGLSVSARTDEPVSPLSMGPSVELSSSKPTAVASDVLLPFMIYSIVKSNPPELVSHLLYVQRYRMRFGAGGEEMFCLINLLAVVEFLENVDLAALGLGDSAKILSVADLAPLPLSQTHFDGESTPEDGPQTTAARLRGRVNQQVGELAGSANKVIFGVVDSSFSALRGLLGNDGLLTPGLPESLTDLAPWNYQRPGFGLLRRGSSFSIASVASSLPVPLSLPRASSTPRRVSLNPDERGQMLQEVAASRPASIAEAGGQESDAERDSAAEESDVESEDPNELGGLKGDARSIRSFGSMMSGDSRDRRRANERKNISDRLANVSVLSRIGVAGKEQVSSSASPQSRRISLLAVAPTISAPTISSRPESPAPRIAPPNSRFLECSAADLRLGEVSELLKEYRRVVEALRTVGAFDE